MAKGRTAKSDPLRGKLALYRVITLAVIAFFLVQLNIVNSTTGDRGVALYTVAILLALPLTMLLDKYLVDFAKRRQ